MNTNEKFQKKRFFVKFGIIASYQLYHFMYTIDIDILMMMYSTDQCVWE